MTTKTCVLICKNSKFLLIKEWNKVKKGYFWNIVKGTFDSKIDNSIFDTINREAEEEIDLKVNIKGLISIFEIKTADDFIIQFNFLAEPQNDCNPTLPKKLIKDEDITEFKWFDIDEFKKLSKDEIYDERVNKIIDQWQKNKLIGSDWIQKFKFQ